MELINKLKAIANQLDEAKNSESFALYDARANLQSLIDDIEELQGSVLQLQELFAEKGFSLL